MIDPTVFKFLDSYTKEDHAVFFGREAETEEIYERCTFSKTLVVYGRSGTGKTSIIRCGLGNAFNDQDWLPILIRRNSDINHDLIKAIRQTASNPAKTEKSLHTEIRNLYLDHFKPIYLIFDQFEELFIFGSSDEIAAFFANIKSLISSDENVRLIFVIREEYLANLTEAEEVIPGFLENRIRIEHLTAKKLRDVVEKMCAAAGINMEEGFSEELTERMTSGNAPLELSYLQVYLDAIRKKYPEAREFTKSMIDSLGNFSDVLRNFLEHQLDNQEDPARGEIILKAFVSAQGTKRLIDLEELKMLITEFGVLIERDQLQSYVSQFVDGRILRQLGEDGKYELRHDTLAKVIYERITLTEKELLEAKQFVYNAYNRFQKNGAELHDEDLDYLAPYAKRLYLKVEQKKFLNESFARKERRQKRKLRLSQFGVVFLLLLLVFAGYLLFENYQIKKLQTKIEESHRLAGLSKSDEIGDPMLAFLLAERAHRIYDGPHTHNALMEAYNRGSAAVTNHEITFVDFYSADSSFTFYNPNKKFRRFSLEDIENIYPVNVAIDNLDALLGQDFYNWGFIWHDATKSSTYFINYSSDTLSVIDGAVDLEIEHIPANARSKVFNHSDSTIVYFNANDQVASIISLPRSDYRKLYFRSDSVFIIAEDELLSLDLNTTILKFDVINNNVPLGRVQYEKQDNIFSIITSKELFVLSPFDLSIKIRIDLGGMKDLFARDYNLDINTADTKISILSEDFLALEFSFDSSSQSEKHTVIYSKSSGNFKRVDAIKGEVLGINEHGDFITYNDNEYSLSFYVKTESLVDASNSTDVEKTLSGMHMIARGEGVNLFFQKESSQDRKGLISKYRIKLISDEGHELWSVDVPKSIGGIESVRATIVKKDQVTLAIQVDRSLKLIEFNNYGHIVFEQNIPDILDDLDITLLQNQKGHYVLIHENIISLIQRDLSNPNLALSAIKPIKSLRDEVLITVVDSTISGIYINEQADLESKFIIHNKFQPLAIDDVKYFPESNLVTVSYDIQGRVNQRTPKSKFAKDVLYYFNPKTGSINPFYDIDSRGKFDWIAPIKEFDHLGNDRPIAYFNMYQNFGKPPLIKFVNILGELDSVKIEVPILEITQEGKYLFASSKDTLVKINLEHLNVEYIPMDGLDVKHTIHHISDEDIFFQKTDFLQSRPSSWSEFINESGIRDTIYSDFTIRPIEHDQKLYFQTQRQFIALKGLNTGSRWIEKSNSIYYTVDSTGRIISVDTIPRGSISEVSCVTKDEQYFLISDERDNDVKILDRTFSILFEFPENTNLLHDESFIHDKYILTSHRLLNQYELFPINGDVTIEMVREQGRLGEMREFTSEEREKYRLN